MNNTGFGIPMLISNECDANRAIFIECIMRYENALPYLHC